MQLTMELFKTYKLWDIEPVRGLDTTLWDKDGVEYTDLYGGHAVISIGHSHPHYVKKNLPADSERPADTKTTRFFCVTAGPRPTRMP